MPTVTFSRSFGSATSRVLRSIAGLRTSLDRRVDRERAHELVAPANNGLTESIATPVGSQIWGPRGIYKPDRQESVRSLVGN